MLSHLWPDIRYGGRMLRRHPTLSTASILTFGLGIGLAAAMFSIVNGVLLKGLPFDEGDRIVLVAGTDTARGERLAGVSVHDYAVFEERQKVFEAIGAFRWVSANLSWDQRDPERFSGAALTVGALRALRVKPAIGGLFRDGEDRPGADPVILIGHRLWRDAFAGALGAIGRTIVANGVARTIVGVMPERFGFPNLEQVWIPLVIDPLATARGRGPQYEVVARLRAGVSIASAQAQMESLAAGLARDYPNTNERLGVRVVPFMERVFGRRIRILMTTMLGVGIGVLLVASVNVSNLLLARASLRCREVAIRQALGARRAALMRLVMRAATFQSGIGLALGPALGLLATAPVGPFLYQVHPRDPAGLVTVVITLGANVLAAGFLGVRRIVRLDPAAILGEE
jgi:putative ABC transport system permease protein